jgi:molecular chaperone DnaK (HSP70)
VSFLREALRQTKSASAGADSGVIEHAIYESTAAASGAVAKVRNSRDVFLVADMGAGTCDLGLYYAVAPAPATEKPIKFASFCDARDVVNRAGRFFDDQLRMQILEKAGIDPGGPESHRLRPSIDREVQNLKHLLFATRTCQITFLDDQPITVTLEEFERRASIRHFVTMFSNAVEKLLRAGGLANLAAKRNGVRCVLTGGGSTTPFVRKLFEESMRVDETNIAFNIVDATPAWIEVADEALVRTYPQMAVAMGGCDPSLPKEVQTVRDIAAPSTIVRVGSIADGYRVATQTT